MSYIKPGDPVWVRIGWNAQTGSRNPVQWGVFLKSANTFDLVRLDGEDHATGIGVNDIIHLDGGSPAIEARRLARLAEFDLAEID